MADTFQSAWQRFHPNSQPVSHLVRETEKNNWLRFHSLPESKRYAENGHEMDVILRRQNNLARFTLKNDPVWMVGYFYVQNPDIIADVIWRKAYPELFDQHALSFVSRVTAPDDEEEYDIFAVKTSWEVGKYDSILRDIANDQQRMLWMSEKSGTIFAPYDGGIDLILPSASHILDLSQRFSDWLSSYPGGY